MVDNIKGMDKVSFSYRMRIGIKIAVVFWSVYEKTDNNQQQQNKIVQTLFSQLVQILLGESVVSLFQERRQHYAGAVICDSKTGRLY